MKKRELIYRVLNKDDIDQNKTIKDPFDFPYLTDNFRSMLGQEIVNRDRFWLIQNNLNIFPFFYTELMKHYDGKKHS